MPPDIRQSSFYLRNQELQKKKREQKDESVSRAMQLLVFHEEVEKELVNYNKHGKDWTETPVDLTLQGTGGYSYNDNKSPMENPGQYYADGKRGSGYGSGNGETKKAN